MDALLVNKSVLLFMLLTMFVTSQMIGGVEASFHLETRVTMTNKLSEQLTLNCQDKNHNDGVHTLQPGESHRFKFLSDFFRSRSLWFCRFNWNGADHNFDIYIQKRDSCHDYECFWEINKEGPCLIDQVLKEKKCYQW
ncbi:unnamed protein product [Lupinus luteus]|uniref:S-protein homolog n=1 Tax=Lupinus luteus TaxID=3873 RepID=A0AAV1X8A0_LUPLU